MTKAKKIVILLGIIFIGVKTVEITYNWINDNTPNKSVEIIEESELNEIAVENQKEKDINNPLPNENKPNEQSKKNEDLKQDKEIQNNIKDNKDTVPEENKKNEKEKTSQVGGIVCKAGCVYGSEHIKGCDKYTENEQIEQEKTPQVGDVVCKAGCVYGSEHIKGCDKYTGNE
ncbi:MAG: hypothetical protein E7G71_00230 [Clostridium perfringens]|nr:hypothetical protein [Clostridium perfringens]